MGQTFLGQTRDAAAPVLARLGPVTLNPSGFLDAIGMSRSATTADTVSTHFGAIPLAPTASESLGSVSHSRLMLRGDLPAGPIHVAGYLESDFLNPNRGQSPFRWRQYWGAATAGKWEILAGRAWSLLRPNRAGTASDVDTMNTHVIDPAYHVGLIGSRVRQVRLTRAMGEYQLAVAWEGPGNVVSKVVRDHHKQHYELGGFTGRGGHRGVTASTVFAVNPRLRIVAQEYWSKRGAYQALAVVSPGIDGLSTLEGLESQVSKNVELYAYGGLVYASRVTPAENRVVRQVSAGINRKVPLPALHASLLFSLQYSHLDRAVWAGRQGVMDFVMYRFRYTFN